MLKWLSLPLLMMWLWSPSWGEPLSLEQACQQALQQSPGIARLQARVLEMLQKVAEVEAGGNPRLDLQAGYSYMAPSLSFSGFPLIVNNNYRAGVILEQALATFGRLSWGRQAAELQVRSLEQELVRERQRLEYQVAVAYSRLQLARQAIEVAELSLQSRRRLLQDLNLREKAGASAKFEVLLAEVARAQDQQRLVLAQQQSQLAQSQLQVLLGWPRARPVETLPLPEGAQVPLPTPEQALETALKQRAELQAMNYAVQAAEARVHLEESQSNPTLGLQTRYDQRNATTFQTSNQWSVGLEMRWPLFDGGLARARSRQAEAVVSQLRAGRRELERQIRLEVEEALVRCGSAFENLEVARHNLTSAGEAARLGELRFRAGVSTHQEVLDAQAHLREARQSLFEAQQSLREADWQLQLALGLMIFRTADSRKSMRELRSTPGDESPGPVRKISDGRGGTGNGPAGHAFVAGRAEAGSKPAGRLEDFC
ncbi:MAG: TolC family protein [Candidatus Eremiobacteraeota bacterium]|nr:TolC family protein [Candidatus Eremiobacteraeota bacterium]MCW5871832.1 TolC family protein [Candidatus Eremiobacteraeota bacterium]